MAIISPLMNVIQFLRHADTCCFIFSPANNGAKYNWMTTSPLTDINTENGENTQHVMQYLWREKELRFGVDDSLSELDKVRKRTFVKSLYVWWRGQSKSLKLNGDHANSADTDDVSAFWEIVKGCRLCRLCKWGEWRKENVRNTQHGCKSFNLSWVLTW